MEKDPNGIKPFYVGFFLGYPWFSWICFFFQFQLLQYITLVLHISLCAVDFKLLFLNVNLLYLKCVLLFIS